MSRSTGWIRASAVGVGFLLLTLGGIGGARALAAATQWQAAVGGATGDQGIQANSFLPRELWVDVGDEITWTQDAGEIHTLTFLSGAPRPDLIGPGPSFNPVAVAPAGGPSYNGTGYTNSGLMAVPGQTFDLTFTAAGNFPFVCLVHADMKGVVHVQPAGTAYPHDQAFYDRQAAAEKRDLFQDGRALVADSLQSNARSEITAGTGALLPDIASVANLRFYPAVRTVKAGSSLTWTNRDPETPHTVTFGTEPPGGPLGAFSPAGVDGAGHATITSGSQSVNSGVIGAGLPFGTEFTVTFTKPGTYQYICALHDDLGMTGTVIVVPGGADN